MTLSTDKLLKWEMAKNMMRSKSNFDKVKMNYSIVAPRMYNGRIESVVSRITGFADMIQLTHLKLQQVLSRMVPDGVYLDADGLAEIDLGNGTNYSPQEALNMFFQTGSVIGRSFTSEGDQNPGKVPIQQIQNGGGGNKIQSLIQTYNYYLQMIRDVTGLNEARDASTPDKNALVGIQKLAAANSNTAFIQAIGAHNVATLKEMKDLHLYDFGIFIELMPDEEEKQVLENNIQMALNQKLIDLDDAIDLRDVRNIKLANQLLKIKRKRKLERDQKMQQENIQAQSQANQQAQQAAAQAETQKEQAKAEIETQLEQTKNSMRVEYLKQEALVKKDLMDHEFQLNMQLRGMENEIIDKRDTNREDRKDQRVDKQAENQQSIKKGESIKKFESSGNDIVGGGLGLNKFNPR